MPDQVKTDSVRAMDRPWTPTVARENPDEVRANLAARGFHLQFPPTPGVDPMHEDWGTDA